MQTLYYICIEPLEERYTKQWYDNFPIEFRKNGFNVVVIDGKPLSNVISVGTFLDINSTIAYKNSQMMQIAELFHNNKINSGDVFFVADTEFWGLESIRLMSQMNNIYVKIVSFLHAASYTIEDAFSVAAPYQKYTELGWLASNDLVFVGSEYHKQAVIDRRIKPYAHKDDINELSRKIIVTGNPLFRQDFQHDNINKKKRLIISNRFDWEKRPNLSLDIAYILKKQIPDLEIIVTTSRPKFKSNKEWLVTYARELEKDGIIKIYENLTKQEYYNLLADSKIMLTNSIEENFGYCIAEALAFNTYPLAPYGLSHNELLQNNRNLLFTDVDDAINKAKQLLNDTVTVSHYIDKYYTAIDIMCNYIKHG